MDQNLQNSKMTKYFVRKMFYSVFFVSLITAGIPAIILFIQGLCLQNFVKDGDIVTAANELAVPFLLLGSFFGTVLSFGFELITARKITTNKEEIPKFFTATILMCVAVYLIFLIPSIFFSKEISQGLIIITGHSHHESADRLIECCADIIKGFYSGFIFHLLFYVFLMSSHLESGKTLSNITSVSTLISTIVGYLLVGYFAPEQYKLFLFKFLNVFVYFPGVVIFIIYYILHQKTTVFKFSLKSLKSQHFGNIWTVGGASGLKKISWALYGLCVNSILLTMGGTRALSAFGVLSHCQKIITLFSVGLYYTAGVLSSIFYSQRNKQYLDYLYKFIHLSILILIVPIGIIFAACSQQIVWLYGSGASDKSLFYLSCYAIMTFSIVLPFITANGLATGFYQGFKSKFLVYITVVLQDFIPAGTMAAFGFASSHMSELSRSYMLLAGHSMGYIIYALLRFFFAWAISRKKNPFTVETQYFLKEEVFFNKKNIIYVSLSNNEDYKKAQILTNDFLKKHKCSNEQLKKAKRLLNSLHNTIDTNGDIKKKCQLCLTFDHGLFTFETKDNCLPIGNEDQLKLFKKQYKNFNYNYSYKLNFLSASI